MFIVEYNILWYFCGPFDHTGSHENFVQGCKIDLIIHLKPCNGYSVSSTFDILINIHEYANMIIFI